MKGIELSKFRPSAPNDKGGIKPIPPEKGVVPVAGSTEGISEQARIIHTWLVEQHAERKTPISVGEGINTHGERKYRRHLQMTVRTLSAFPLEELLDASLLYVAEDDL